MKITIELVDKDGDQVPVELPAKYEVCPKCDGTGTQCTIGAMTGDEYREACFDDPDFPENYKRGMYNTSCSECRGKRVVLVPDQSKLDADTKARLQRHYDDEAEYAAEAEAERRYGC